jgi:flagellar basal-body rod modification protein FlgD
MEITPAPPLLGPPAKQGDAAGRDASPSAEGSAAASADFDSFLNLLTAQLRNQDPLQPLDSTQFVAQLASFSTVEQLIGANDRLDEMLANGAREGAFDYVDWIGRRVSLGDGSFFANGEPVTFAIPGEPGADSAVATIRAADGSVVHTLPVPPGGASALQWDGLEASGTPLRGQMTMDVSFFSGDELAASRAAEVFRTVAGLRGTAEGAELQLADGGTARPEEVSAVRADT